jgi:hypothetical protein
MISPPLVETPVVKLKVGGAASKAECAALVKTYRSAASKYVSPNTNAKALQTDGGSQSSETAVSIVATIPVESRLLVVPFGKVDVIP